MFTNKFIMVKSSESSDYTFHLFLCSEAPTESLTER